MNYHEYQLFLRATENNLNENPDVTRTSRRQSRRQLIRDTSGIRRAFGHNDALRRVHEDINIGRRLIIVDELHDVRSSSSNRHNIQELLQQCLMQRNMMRRLLYLSATPISDHNSSVVTFPVRQ